MKLRLLSFVSAIIGLSMLGSCGAENFHPGPADDYVGDYIAYDSTVFVANNDTQSYVNSYNFIIRNTAADRVTISYPGCSEDAWASDTALDVVAKNCVMHFTQALKVNDSRFDYQFSFVNGDTSWIYGH